MVRFIIPEGSLYLSLKLSILMAWLPQSSTANYNIIPCKQLNAAIKRFVTRFHEIWEELWFIWPKVFYKSCCKHYVKVVRILRIFWSVFSQVWAVYGDLQSKHWYSVWIWEHKTRKNVTVIIICFKSNQISICFNYFSKFKKIEIDNIMI